MNDYSQRKRIFIVKDYRISSNKSPLCLFNFKFYCAALIGGQRLKEGDAYFKVREKFI